MLLHLMPGQCRVACFWPTDVQCTSPFRTSCCGLCCCGRGYRQQSFLFQVPLPHITIAATNRTLTTSAVPCVLWLVVRANHYEPASWLHPVRHCTQHTHPQHTPRRRGHAAAVSDVFTTNTGITFSSVTVSCRLVNATSMHTVPAIARLTTHPVESQRHNWKQHVTMAEVVTPAGMHPTHAWYACGILAGYIWPCLIGLLHRGDGSSSHH